MPNKKCFCGKKVASIIGDCKFCDNKFCLVHRLPESHECVGLANCCREAKERNEEKLLNEKCVGTKI